ncbi:MAG TPA: HI0074 family nucleotidyltransferase substrate-binding subunit [Oligoflexia bacterium]|nr:HI0074 family nucleotidyltransferase substrate-binding subunit [Oligoflexia bacterium]
MDKKWAEAIELLESALKRETKDQDRALTFAARAKAFEVAFEYTWKCFKRAADQAGLEVYSPRDAIKAAAQMKLIADLEKWQQFLNARNLSVHDYIGIEDDSFAKLIAEFLAEARRLK